MVALLMLTAGLLLLARTTLASRSAVSAQRSTWSTKKAESDWISLISISWPVAMLVITSRMQGGGVIGRLSLSPKPHIRARCGCWTTSSEYRNPSRSLLDDIFLVAGLAAAGRELPLELGGCGYGCGGSDECCGGCMAICMYC